MVLRSSLCLTHLRSETTSWRWPFLNLETSANALWRWMRSHRQSEAASTVADGEPDCARNLHVLHTRSFCVGFPQRTEVGPWGRQRRHHPRCTFCLLFANNPIVCSFYLKCVFLLSSRSQELPACHACLLMRTCNSMPRLVQVRSTFNGQHRQARFSTAWFYTCGAPIDRSVAQISSWEPMTRDQMESVSPIWQLGHVGKERTCLLNLRTARIVVARTVM